MKQILSFLIFLCLLAYITKPAYAASGTMSISPNTGSYNTGSSFSVDLVIDGKGDSFNAAEATVKVSSNTQINNLVLGDCGFSFVKTPTSTDPSFTGVILGGSTTKCTAYALILTPLSPGSATITLTKAGIKKYGNATELLGTTQNALYTITGEGASSSNRTPSAISPQITLAQTNPENYTLSLTALTSDNTPIGNAMVNIDNNANSSQVNQLKAETDTNGQATIHNIGPGVHTVKVEKDGKQVSQTILNFTGTNPVLTLGVKEQKQPANWTIIIIVGILIFILAVLLLLRSGFLKAIKHAA